ncbi:hypothetical protein L5876_01525 [Hyphobacterium sp. SN044]|uniref:hypothetical protein n=1 Tax=Hyphobacterium sp. SN044 TaxID=2912575 RepID=UPI001F3E1E09|nr:hypothetical protein [Hyphobacterium sp. SN044]MCF8878493.1 hypothetical protein [Hyphobacterium sp. SN044]
MDPGDALRSVCHRVREEKGNKNRQINQSREIGQGGNIRRSERDPAKSAASRSARLAPVNAAHVKASNEALTIHGDTDPR